MAFRYNPITGNLDVIAEQQAGEAARLVISRIASVNIAAMKLVKSDSATHVSIATSQGTFEDSEVLGLALASVVAGQLVDILIFGAIQDASFSFTLNDPAFLGGSGQVRQTVPAAPTDTHSVRVGKAIATDELFLNITQPIVLS